MTTDHRGGNSRQLAKLLDQFVKPIVIVDRRGQIVFVNSACCQMTAADATQLVGKQCLWEVPADETPLGAFLCAIAPPAATRAGQIHVRSWEPWHERAASSSMVGDDQCFIPFLDEDHVVDMTLVLFGTEADFARQSPANEHESRFSDPDLERTVASVRARWKQLDKLHALVGESPAIRLSMDRAQMAIASKRNFWIYGPPGVGKTEVSKGIFAGRLKSQNMQPIAGQYFPIDARILDAALMDGMLEVFASRLRPGEHRYVQQLVVQNVDQLTPDALQRLLDWMTQYADSCSFACISQTGPLQLAARGKPWQELVARTATIEIEIPALRTRVEDVGALVHHALAVTCRKSERALLTVTPSAMELLQTYTWPGNLRQLQATIEESVAHAVLTSSIKPNHLPVEIRTYPTGLNDSESSAIAPINLDQLLEDVERIVIRRALKLSPRNRAQVARWLEISRPRLLRRITQLGLGDASEEAEADED